MLKGKRMDGMIHGQHGCWGHGQRRGWCVFGELFTPKQRHTRTNPIPIFELGLIDNSVDGGRLPVQLIQVSISLGTHRHTYLPSTHTSDAVGWGSVWSHMRLVELSQASYEKPHTP